MLPENEGLSAQELRQEFGKYDKNSNMKLGRTELESFHHDHSQEQGTAATENQPRSEVNWQVAQLAREAPLLSSGRRISDPVELSTSHPVVDFQQSKRDDCDNDPSPSQVHPVVSLQVPPSNDFLSSQHIFGGIFPQIVVNESNAAPAHSMMGHAHLEAENHDDLDLPDPVVEDSDDDLDLPDPVESPRGLSAREITRGRARLES